LTQLYLIIKFLFPITRMQVVSCVSFVLEAERAIVYIGLDGN